MVKYKLFHDVENNAVFTDNKCDQGHLPPFLEGEYFDGDYEDSGVCLECLNSGRKKVVLDEYMRSKILKYANDYEKTINELERTPPVPWIQYNDWPFCCGNAMQYRGEYSSDAEFYLEEGVDVKGWLWESLDNDSKTQAVNQDTLYGNIESGMVSCFVFKCICCSKLTSVCQSY